jgi:ferredoxin-thioredoxin reductase catalytic chain
MYLTLLLTLVVAANPFTFLCPLTRRYTSSVLWDKSKNLSPEEKEIALEKATKAMTAFTNKYLKNTGTTLCSDKVSATSHVVRRPRLRSFSLFFSQWKQSVAAVVVKGLAEHKVSLGSPLCPCRFYEDKEAEAKDGYWNCPCVPMRERHECHW